MNFSISQLYILRGERTFSLQSLIQLYSIYFKEELKEIYGDEWEKKIRELLNTWTLPTSRLLPPFKYIQSKNSLSREALINYYHLQWANEVCFYLESTNTNNEINYVQLFERLFPIIHQLWLKLGEKEPNSFNHWLREHIAIDINEQGEIHLTKFHLDKVELKKFSTFSLAGSKLKSLKQSELVNWLFIKSVLQVD